jgi:hypothetical protein
MLRIHLLRILYGDDNCDFLIQNMNKDCVNNIAEFLCIGFTLNNETIQSIKQLHNKPYTFHTFGNIVSKLIDQYEHLESKLARIKLSELLYRTINIYYAKIASIKTSYFTQVTYNKAIILEMECNNECNQVNKTYMHNYNTRYNSKRIQTIELLHLTRGRFIKESKEYLHLSNNINDTYPIQTTIWM